MRNIRPAIQILEPRQLLASTIKGTVWSDLDADQLMESTEPRSANVTVFLDDRVRDGKLGKHERRTTTDADGNYTFTNVSPGKHVVAAIAPEASQSQSWPVVGSTFNIEFSFDGSLSNRERLAFTEAAQLWERVILGDIRNVGGHVDDIEIEVKPSGSVPPDNVRAQTTIVAARNVAPYLPHLALIVVNEDYRRSVSRQTLYFSALHEIGHALGFGDETLWSDLGLASGSKYTGKFALDQYKTIFEQNSATSVPLESTGGAGTVGSHWDGEAVQDGKRFDLMAPTLTDDETLVLSTLTVGAMRDLGYDVNYRAAQPWKEADASLFRDRNPDEVVASNRRRRYSVKLKNNKTRRHLDFGFVPKETETSSPGNNSGGNNTGGNNTGGNNTGGS